MKKSSFPSLMLLINDKILKNMDSYILIEFLGGYIMAQLYFHTDILLFIFFNYVVHVEMW